jgi:hypothetical protein
MMTQCISYNRSEQDLLQTREVSITLGAETLHLRRGTGKSPKGSAQLIKDNALKVFSQSGTS